MDRDDIEGAKAAAEYFLELYPYVFATGDLDEWEAMSHPECQFCRGTADAVDELFAKGGHGAGGGIVIDDIAATDPDDDWPHYRVAVTGRETPSVEYASDGAVLREFDGGPAQYNFAIILRDGNWVVRGVNIDVGD